MPSFVGSRRTVPGSASTICDPVAGGFDAGFSFDRARQKARIIAGPDLALCYQGCEVLRKGMIRAVG